MVTELEPLLAPEVMGRKDGDADDNGDPHFTPAMVQLLPGRFKTVRWRWESLCCVFAMVSLGTAPVSPSGPRSLTRELQERHFGKQPYNFR